MIKLIRSVYKTYFFFNLSLFIICIFICIYFIICIYFLFITSYYIKQNVFCFHAHILYWVTSIMLLTCLLLELTLKPEGDSGSYGSVGSPVRGSECRSAEFDGLQAQCDQAMHQLQLLRHKHSDTIRRFVLILFQTLCLALCCYISFLISFFILACKSIFLVTYKCTHFTFFSHKA